ncbi:MAG: hypothetical protein K2I96_25645 [Lachnospiraceae bacterium]|nr:hypothetical protein [Lachnospiraceae bacterium]
MEYKDAQAITDAEIEQGWDATIEKIEMLERRSYNKSRKCKISWSGG